METTQLDTANQLESAQAVKVVADLLGRGQAANGRRIMEPLTVGPAVARELLKLNRSNRNKILNAVKRLADDFRQGRYREGVDVLRITTDGELCDGQHRLYAVIAAGGCYEMDVVLNTPPDAKEVMGFQVSRTLAQARTIAGKAGATKAVQSAAGQMVRGVASKAAGISKYLISEVIDAYLDDIQWVCDRANKPGALAGVKAAVCRAKISGEDEDRLADFLAVFNGEFEHEIGAGNLPPDLAFVQRFRAALLGGHFGHGGNTSCEVYRTSQWVVRQFLDGNYPANLLAAHYEIWPLSFDAERDSEPDTAVSTAWVKVFRRLADHAEELPPLSAAAAR